MTHYLYRTFEYYDPTQNATSIELRITFEYSRYCPGPNIYAAVSATRDLIRAEREVAGSWLPVGANEWLYMWCIDAFEAAEDDDLVRAMGEQV